jgi:glycogen operon protein
MIWMGDESGNTQKGNNNAYCQDNEIGWKDWGNTKRSRELYRFVCRLAQLRHRYPALRNPNPMEMADYLRCGYPDLSYHSSDGWQVQLDGNHRAVGMLYCTKYAADKVDWKKLKEDFIYVGYNFSETEQELALPPLPRGYTWHYVLDTSVPEPFAETYLPGEPRRFQLPDHTVCVLTGKRKEK